MNGNNKANTINAADLIAMKLVKYYLCGECSKCMEKYLHFFFVIDSSEKAMLCSNANK